jgi:hypothetical protein
LASSAAGEISSAGGWGPVRRGFGVWLADGRRGSVADIRRGRGGGVELLVVTGLFFRTQVTVPAAEIEVIQPGLRRIIVGGPPGGGHEAGVDGDVETPGVMTTFSAQGASSAAWPRDPA